jgi:SpoVK/Ycf46/Vps4 family AAA+-type ATPase
LARADSKKKVLTESSVEPIEEDFDQVLQELDALVGLQEVKKEFRQLVDYLKIGKLKEAQGIKSHQLSLHMVFRGNPGTGKTTVARLVGRVFKSLGFLSKGHVVETDRSGLVGEYVGQTAQKTNKMLDEAMGGILFVDEAYALSSGSKSDFGDEALEAILKRMEDQRDQLVVIFAGYPDEMDELLQSNPGLKSRFANHLNFEDFSAEQLLSILKKMLVKSSHFLTVNAEQFASKYLQFIADTSDRYFGNAREVRNLFEDLLKSQSSRLAKQIAENANASDQLSYEELRQIHLPDLRECYQFDYEEYHEETLEDILAELNELIGLGNIKQEIEEMARYIEILKRRKESGLSTDIPGMHAVFMGSPGTGKTTVARLLARIYKSLGIIKKEVLVEASRQDLVAEFVGQTAVKTNKLIDKAMHGVLFIDEAYALTSRGGNDFGQEAIEVLLKRMEDDRDDLVVIVAGYQEPMTQFLESNPGLPSRFNKKYNFKDFDEKELQDIFMFYLDKSSYVLDKQGEALLQDRIDEKLKTKTEFFGNARWVRKLFEACKISQAQRLSTMSFISEEDLQLLTKDDLDNAFNKVML